MMVKLTEVAIWYSGCSGKAPTAMRVQELCTPVVALSETMGLSR